MAVLDKNMNDVNEQDVKESIRTIQDYIAYMKEQIDYNDALIKKRLHNLDGK